MYRWSVQMARPRNKLPGFGPVPSAFTAATASGLPASPEKRILMREKACRKTERGKNDRCTQSTVRSIVAAREHGRPLHSAWSLPQGHGVRDGGGGKVFRVPGPAGLVRLGRRDLRDARRTGAHPGGL